MISRIAIAGHPIHPALVPIPIGLAVGTLAADLMYVLGGREQFWYDVALWAGWGAVSSGVLAALPGLGDFLGVARHTDARDPALAHMLLNIGFLAAFTVAGLLMLGGNAREGGALAAVIVLHVASLQLLGISGWIGGELSYRHHIGVVPDDRASARSERTHHTRW